MESSNFLIGLSGFKAAEPAVLYRTGRASAIQVLGELNITGKGGKDITSEFPPKLQEMFLLILLHSNPSRYEKTGIKTDKLTEILWPSTDSASAKNARGVAVKRLRNILAEMDGIELRYEDPYWSIVCGEGCVCDYFRMLKLNDELNKHTGTFQRKKIKRELYELLNRGKLLKDQRYDWLHSIKAEMTFLLVNGVMSAAENADEFEDEHLKLNLAEIILKWDALNENALKLKIRSLNKLGRYGEAKAAYDVFAREFAVSFQMNYGIKYSDLLYTERVSA
jgi:two-component SAPR family response regulator